MIDNQNRIGLAVMDAQTLHIGHVMMLMHLMAATSRSIVGIGSVRKFGTEGHPFTFEQRKQMITTVFGEDRFSFIQLDDIDATLDNDEWCEYVLKKVAAIGMPTPTDYFSGSRIDAKWYENHFAPMDDTNPLVTVHHAALKTVFENSSTGRRIHIVNREQFGLPSGREVRFLIEKRDPEWLGYVPQRLHDFIEMNYPPHLRQVIRGTKFPDPQLWPVGTRFKLDLPDGGDDIFELKDDGNWRRPSTEPGEKALYARKRKQQGEEA